MVTLESGTLGLHIAAGVVAVLAGLGALATTKGGRRHRRAGRTFAASMGVVVATVVPLFALDPTRLRAVLALVAVFSGYLAFSGYRVLSHKRPTDEAEPVDSVAAALTVAACATLGGWGVVRALGGDSFGVVMVVFGGIGLAFGASDLRRFRAGATSDDWVADHLARMVAAFVATVSAVSAVNLTMLPGVVRWLWPTMLGVPLIAYWQEKYDALDRSAG